MRSRRSRSTGSQSTTDADSTPGTAPHAFHDAIVERGQHGTRRIARLRRRQPGRDELSGVEAGVRELQLVEAADEQRRAGEQRQREARLRRR